MIVRVTPDKYGSGYVVTHPEGYSVTLVPGDAYEDTDPLVREFPWAFEADNVDLVVEQASAAPGEKRSSTRRPRTV